MTDEQNKVNTVNINNNAKLAPLLAKGDRGIGILRQISIEIPLKTNPPAPF